MVTRDGIEPPTPAFSGLLSTIDPDKFPRGKLRPNQIARENAWRAVYFSARGVPATGRSSREPAFPERLSTRRLVMERPFATPRYTGSLDSEYRTAPWLK